MALPSWLDRSFETLRNGGNVAWTREFEIEARQYAMCVDHYDSATPASSKEMSIESVSVILKMIEVYVPRNTMSDAARDAFGEAYGDALHDLPVWTIKAAMIDWHRGECGEDQSGKPFWYNRYPMPAELRLIAERKAVLARWRAKKVRELFSGESNAGKTKEHRDGPVRSPRSERHG